MSNDRVQQIRRHMRNVQGGVDVHACLSLIPNVGLHLDTPPTELGFSVVNVFVHVVDVLVQNL
jgi:hypothetical protein